MSKFEFMALCGEHLIDPDMALENDNLNLALLANGKQVPKQIYIATMDAWINSGAITEYARGEENVYLVNEFGHEFYCKCLA